MTEENLEDIVWGRTEIVFVFQILKRIRQLIPHRSIRTRLMERASVRFFLIIILIMGRA